MAMRGVMSMREDVFMLIASLVATLLSRLMHAKPLFACVLNALLQASPIQLLKLADWVQSILLL